MLGHSKIDIGRWKADQPSIGRPLHRKRTIYLPMALGYRFSIVGDHRRAALRSGGERAKADQQMQQWHQYVCRDSADGREFHSLHTILLYGGGYAPDCRLPNKRMMLSQCSGALLLS